MKLDAGGLFDLGIDGQRVCLASHPGGQPSRLHDALRSHLLIELDGVRCSLERDGTLCLPPDTRHLTVTLGGRLLGRIALHPTRAESQYVLSPFETRYLADNGHPHPSVDAGSTVEHRPLTDLHCHFAAAPPVADLAPWTQGALDGLHLPLDRQSTFVEMEGVYRLRAPVMKSLDLFVPMLRRIAANYRADHVRYAELSMGDIHQADRLRLAEEALPVIEAETGVRLRFLLAFSRHSDWEWDEDLIDRVEALAGSRALVGVDFMGHETTSTHAFARQLQRLSKIASPGFVIRVHAGENPAHPENVGAVLEHVTSRDVCLRIGHGLFGVDDATLDALAERKAIVEFNLNSNFALNNIQTSSEVPLRRYLARGVRCVLSTDGPGLYQTSMKYEVQAARLCGVTDAELGQMQRAEIAYLALNEAVERSKPLKFVVPQDSPAKHYTPAVAEAKRAARSHRDATLLRKLGGLLVKEPSSLLDGKRPVAFAGAWMHAWGRMPEADRARVTALLDALMPQLPRDRVVVVTGGTTHGVEGEVLKRARQLGLPVLATLVNESPPDAIAEGLTHVCLVAETLHDKAAGLYHLMQQHDGLCLFFGGGNVVSDEIQVATNLRLRYLLLADVAGASGTHAAEQPHRAFRAAGDVMALLDDKAFFQAAFAPFWHLGRNPTVDVAVVRRHKELLLIRRHPDAPAEPGQWALPGGFVPTAAPRGTPWTPGVETVEETAVREVRQEAGLDVPQRALMQLGTFEGGGRDVRDTPTAWSSTTLFALMLDGSPPLAAGDDACEARWWPLEALPPRLAFDHARLIKVALGKLYGAPHG